MLANAPFWGENLEPLACTPLAIPTDRLVLAPHTYGPDVFGQPYFNDPAFPNNMAALLACRRSTRMKSVNSDQPGLSAIVSRSGEPGSM